MNDKGRPEAAPDQSATTAPMIPPPGTDFGLCHADEFGLMDIRCLWAVLDAETRAYVRGYRQALADRDADVWAESCRVVDNAARSIRAEPANPYAVRGTDAELRAFAAGCRHAERERFRADHARRRASVTS